MDESFINYATKKTEIDIKKWEQWLIDHPHNKQTLEDARNIVIHLRFKNKELPKTFVASEWNKLKESLQISNLVYTEKSISNHSRKIWISVAAASLLILMALSFYFHKPLQQQRQTLSYQEIIVPKGETKKTLLPDGSLVYINSDSKIKFDSCFSGENREIFLEGEAYFEVKHNKDKPFIVHTIENDIRVLGTSFNVYAYVNENVFRTSLEQGKISLTHNKGKEIELEVNQTYLLLRNTNQIKLFETNNIENYSAWRNGEILFKNQKFTDILKKLERTHNLTFLVYNNKVGNYNYTGCFSTEDDINTILEVIKLPTPFEYEILKDTVIIK